MNFSNTVSHVAGLFAITASSETNRTSEFPSSLYVKARDEIVNLGYLSKLRGKSSCTISANMHQNSNTDFDVKPEIPKRVRQRPKPEEWAEDELLTLPEAATLMWPQGPLTTASLRTAARQGQLRIAIIAGKYFTSRRALSEMAENLVVLNGSVAESAPTLKKDDALVRLDEIMRRKQ